VKDREVREASIWWGSQSAEGLGFARCEAAISRAELYLLEKAVQDESPPWLAWLPNKVRYRAGIDTASLFYTGM
jgi:hypothetical protein